MDLLLGTRPKRKKRRANSCVGKYSTSNQSMLECHSPLHMRPSMINTLCDGEELVMDLAGFLVILGFPSLNELDQELGCNIAVTNKESIHIKGSMKKILVVTSKNLKIRS